MKLRSEDKLVSIGFSDDVNIILGITSLDLMGCRIYMDMYGIFNSKPK